MEVAVQSVVSDLADYLRFNSGCNLAPPPLAEVCNVEASAHDIVNPMDRVCDFAGRITQND